MLYFILLNVTINISVKTILKFICRRIIRRVAIFQKRISYGGRMGACHALPEGGRMGKREHPLVWYYDENRNFAELLNGWLFCGEEYFAGRISAVRTGEFW